MLLLNTPSPPKRLQELALRFTALETHEGAYEIRNKELMMVSMHYWYASAQAQAACLPPSSLLVICQPCLVKLHPGMSTLQLRIPGRLLR